MTSSFPDPSIISRAPGGPKRLGHKCSNFECAARGSETTLKVCARCKAVKYCSRECQTKDWKNHKPACTNNAEHAAQLAQADQSGILAHSLPHGITLTDLDQRLEKWIKFHNSTLMAATIHALALPRDIKRSRTHIVRMQVSYREDNNGAPGKFFRVDKAEAIEMDEARTLGGAWPESLVQIGKLREESEKRRMGTVAAIGVECYPLAVQIVPFGSLRDLSPLELVKNWEQVLKRDVQNAKKFTKFGP